MTEELTRRKIPTLNDELMEELHVTFLELSQERGFPDSCCNKISKDISLNLGFAYQEGFFELDSLNSKGDKRVIHSWCKDATGTIIDLTAHQFNANLIKPLPKSIQIVHLDDPLYKRYLPINKSK